MDSGDRIRVPVEGQPGAFLMVDRAPEHEGKTVVYRPGHGPVVISTPPAPPSPFVAGCPYFGPETGERITCDSCKGNVELKVYSCQLFGKCLPGRDVPGVKSCMGCTRRIDPDKVTTLAFPMTFRGDPYRNSAIFEDGDRLRLLLRCGWGSAGLAAHDLGDDLQPKGWPMPLFAYHQAAPEAQEDPRIFRHNNRTHVSFCGIRGKGRDMFVSVLYARMKKNGMEIEDTWAPHYEQRQVWEKNWAFFSHDGNLYAVYAISPVHQVLKIDGETATLAHEHEWRTPWHRGDMRGGASPVLFGDEYWCFFHGVENYPGRQPKRVYTAGVYTFEARPPFAPKRCTPYPVILPSDHDRNGLDISVVYPCGAVRRGDRWLVSYGYHDREVRIAEFDHAAVERALVAC